VVVNNACVIGRNCILAQNVTLASKDGGAPELGDWVYVGANSVVLGGVKIGNNTFIGALSLVNKDVPDNAIVVGIPAKVLKIRTKEEVDDWHLWVMKNGGEKIDEIEGTSMV
jgi:serine O-acetyltransferase